MARRRSAASRREQSQKKKAFRNILIAAIVVAVLGVVYVRAMLSHRSLDEVTLCPPQPESITVLLVDVTDPMNLPQRQDFLNQLGRLRSSIPRYGKLVVVKVDPISDRLLMPVITRCNPGTAQDVDDLTGNPQAAQRRWEQQFRQPLDRAFEGMLTATSADRSPILESIQSVALTQFQSEDVQSIARRLIVASDLLQNTDDISFYGQLPDPTELTSSQAFSRVRTDLRGVDVQLWMLQRADSRQSQPRALPTLWEVIIDRQGGSLARLYTVSG